MKGWQAGAVSLLVLYFTSVIVGAAVEAAVGDITGPGWFAGIVAAALTYYGLTSNSSESEHSED